MDRFDHAFTALGQRINSLSLPERTASAPVPLASLIERVNAAKRLYQPGVRPQTCLVRSATTIPAIASSAPAPASAVQR